MVDIRQATAAYERWLGGHLTLVEADLRVKHRHMAEAEFAFLRATFYRWCQLWRALAPGERAAPSVLAVGDLHLENFGTWRDAEGRRRAVRVCDPTVQVIDGWLVRRLAPHCTRIELAELPGQRDETRLLFSMGWETANVHLGTPGAGPRLLRDLHRRKGRWLHELSKTFGAATAADWTRWRTR